MKSCTTTAKLAAYDEADYRAVINITTMNGEVAKPISLTTQGKGQIVLDAAQLITGTYNYALIVNGQLIDAKKLILTR